MVKPIRAAFVGAGNRAYSAHYPVVARLADTVTIEAVCELEPARLARGGDYFQLPAQRRFTDLSTMLSTIRPELVYAIMGPRQVAQVAEQCFAAGAHVVIEKPPGASLAETERLAQAARTAQRQGMVTFQRRYAAVIEETRRRIAARGSLTLCIVEFHKQMLQLESPPWGVSTLWEDIVHVVDLARYLCGGSVTAVHAYRDAHASTWPNSYTALVRFETGATAVISGNRSSGGRFLRVEAHGPGLGAYLDDFPHKVRFLSNNGADVEEMTGAYLAASAATAPTDRAVPVAGSANLDEPAYDGLLAMHRHFLSCVQTNQPAISSIDEALETMRLIDRIERGER